MIGRGHHRVQSVGCDLAVALAVPQHAGRGLGLVELEHHRAVVETGHQQAIPALDRGGHRHAVVDLERMLPVHASGFRIERRDRQWMPDDQLPRPPGRDDDRLRVARFRCRRQRAPEFAAGHLVERDDLGVRRAADETDQSRAIDERRARDAPDRNLRAVLTDVVPRPEGSPVSTRRHESAPARPSMYTRSPSTVGVAAGPMAHVSSMPV